PCSGAIARAQYSGKQCLCRGLNYFAVAWRLTARCKVLSRAAFDKSYSCGVILPSSRSDSNWKSYSFIASSRTEPDRGLPLFDGLAEATAGCGFDVYTYTAPAVRNTVRTPRKSHCPLRSGSGCSLGTQSSSRTIARLDLSASIR